MARGVAFILVERSLELSWDMRASVCEGLCFGLLWALESGSANGP